MTAEEHQLFVLMFGIQERKIQTLLKILEDKGIVDGHEFDAIQFAAELDSSGSLALAEKVGKFWVEMCQKCGVLSVLPSKEQPTN